jgi:hypothetical protein
MRKEFGPDKFLISNQSLPRCELTDTKHPRAGVERAQFCEVVRSEAWIASSRARPDRPRFERRRCANEGGSESSEGQKRGPAMRLR